MGSTWCLFVWDAAVDTANICGSFVLYSASVGKVQQMSVKNVLVKKENVSLDLAFELGKSQTAPFLWVWRLYFWVCNRQMFRNWYRNIQKHRRSQQHRHLPPLVFPSFFFFGIVFDAHLFKHYRNILTPALLIVGENSLLVFFCRKHEFLSELIKSTVSKL